MNSTTSQAESFGTPAHQATDLPAHLPFAAKRVLQLLSRLRHGSLTLQLPDHSSLRFGDAQGAHVSLQLHNWAMFGRILKSGDIGFAESYIAGDWTTSNLTELLRLFVRNRTEMENIIYGSWAGRLAYRIKHLLHRNTRAQAQKNIHVHYDLGNAFYRLWLDETMNYSSAWFNGDFAQPSAQAQRAKVLQALRSVQLQPGQRLLEIGCGWGALAEMAASAMNAHVTGVTLSHEQLAYAKDRLATAGLAQSADLRLQDYRDIADAPFDAICSIEMVEAVGREYWPDYFATVARLLKPGGKACIQSIVIDDALFERYLQSTDFIQQYIFPGGCLPNPSALRAQAAKAGLELVHELNFGRDYAETLRRWRDRFTLEKTKVLQLGFDERFVRIWEFYLAYCEAAFDEANIDVVQFTFRKPL